MSASLRDCLLQWLAASAVAEELDSFIRPRASLWPRNSHHVIPTEQLLSAFKSLQVPNLGEVEGLWCRDCSRFARVLCGRWTEVVDISSVVR